MNGRLQTNYKIETKIENDLKNYPDYLSGWYYYLRASNKELSSCRDYITKVVNFLSFVNSDINSIKPSDITYDNVTRYMICRQNKKINGNLKNTSDSYKTTLWYALKSFLEYLSSFGYIEKNYINDIPKPKNNDNARINNERLLLTEYEFNLILEAVKNGAGDDLSVARQTLYKERDMAIMLVFMYTGMRRTALSNINIEDIDFDTNTLTVIDKGNKIQTYTLSNKVMSAIKNWLDKRETLNVVDKDALFISRLGKRISGKSLYDIVEKYCEEALGRKVSPHKLRSGFCSIMYNKTKDIEKVRRMVGHSNLATTQRYIVTPNQERKESTRIMDNLLTF